jgi:hypothetical protein
MQILSQAHLQTTAANQNEWLNGLWRVGMKLRCGVGASSRFLLIQLVERANSYQDI